MGDKSDHELKIPKWLMRLVRPCGAYGFSYPKQSRILYASIFVMSEVCWTLLCILSQNFVVLLILLVTIVLFGSLLVTMFVFPIVIRKDCANCKFGFHLIAHERMHLRLDSLDEDEVETKTLEETGNQLIPLLLSDRSVCKGCRFKYYKMLSQSTSEYVKETLQVNS